MKVVDGALLTRAHAKWPGGEDFESYVGGTWAGLYSNVTAGGAPFLVSGWYPRSFSSHLLLGSGGFTGAPPMCQQWIGAQPLVECTTTRVPAASAQLWNGPIVMAETGGFGLRFPDGRETSLAGHPGDNTKFVVAEAHGNAAWAVTGNNTDTGWKYYLQRYEG